MKDNKKELVCYSIILSVLILLGILNNMFWKLGKDNDILENNISYLESNNVIYDIPFTERVLD